MSIAPGHSETKLLTRPQAAAWLRERYHVGSKSWLAALSVKGEGPNFVIVGRQALYLPIDLAKWIENRFFAPKTNKPSKQAVVVAEPIRELPSEESLGEDSYLAGVDVESIALGLKIAAELAAKTMRQSYLTPNSVFSADRRRDVSVELNAPIANALGDEAQSITDYLTKSGAAVLEPYPDLSIRFSIARMIADGEGFIRQYVKLNTIAPSVEIRLFDIMHSATNWLRSFDELAFVTAKVMQKPEDQLIHLKQLKRRKRRYFWRCDNND
ncbi:MAG: hypothetical protein EB015_14275 [Methylocystaceae bacterium]|nr:hypothetical protein [Methylocystaceae bacterium]